MRRIQTSILAALVVVVLHPAAAQPLENWQPLPLVKGVAQKEAATWHTLSLRNAPAALMAWWLDPRYNAAPPGMASARASKATSGSTNLPQGVEAVLTAGPRQELLVFGTDAGFQEVENIAAFLDQPLRHVEIEAYYIEVSPEAARAFNLSDVPQVAAREADSALARMQFVEADFHSVLNSLAAEGKARVLSAPRMTAVNNQRASVEDSTGEIVSLTVNETPAQVPEEKVFSQRISQFAATSSLNNDGSITLEMELTKWINLRTFANGSSLKLAPSVHISPVCNIQAGRFVAISGNAVQSSLLGGAPPQDAANTERNVILFVTAREIKDE